LVGDRQGQVVKGVIEYLVRLALAETEVSTLTVTGELRFETLVANPRGKTIKT
jgi:hypothetical protein